MSNSYTKRPITIEAVQLTWENWGQVCEFITLPWGENGVHGVYHAKGIKYDDENNCVTPKVICDSGAVKDRIALVIPTLEGDHLALENDYIIKGIKGEFYPCKPDIFEASYDEGRHSNATGHIFDEDKKKWVRRVEVKYMIRMSKYIETEKSKKEGRLLGNLVSDFVTAKSTLLKFDSEEEAANYIKDELYHFVKTMMFEIVKVYS